MKNLNLLIIGLLIAFTASAKSAKDGYTMFYNHYNDFDEVITFKLSGSFANMFIEGDDVESAEFMEKMEKISFLIADNVSKEMIVDLNKAMPAAKYKTMMEIKDGGSEVIFFAREDGTAITEILMTVVDDDSLVVMCIYGDFTEKDAKHIAKSINKDSAMKIRM